MRNVHTRTIPGDLAAAGAMLDALGGPADVLWPSERWTPMVLDRPVGVGATGGHGSIRYRVEAHEPGRRVTFRFHPGLGLDGTHCFDVEPAGEGSVRLRHEVDGRLRGRMRVLWPLLVRWLHDAVLEDLLDNAELALTGAVERPARHALPIRGLRVLGGRPRDAGGVAASLATLLPDPDVLVGHERFVRARVDRVDWALRSFTLDEMPVAKVLVRARGLRRGLGTQGRRPLLAKMAAGGFGVVADESAGPGHVGAATLVLGAIGKPWRHRGDLATFGDAEGFRAWDEPGFAKMGVAFTLLPVPGGTRVVEETRVLCTDAASRKRFGRYWRLVGWGSGVVRRQMLSAIARRAEGSGGGPPRRAPRAIASSATSDRVS